VPADGYLDEVVELLWSGHELRAPRLGRPGRGTGERTLVAIPSVRRPNLIVQLGPRRATAAAVRSFHSTGSWRRRLLGRAVTGALRAGAGEVMPARFRRRFRAAPGEHGFVAALADVFGQQVQTAVWLGPPRAVRKPVLHVVDGGGTTLGFVKLGTEQRTRALVHAEAAALSWLAEQPLRTVRVPRLLRTGTWNGNEYVALEALPKRGATSAGPAVFAAMNELARAGEVERAPLAGSRYWRALTERVAALEPGEYTTALHGELERIRATCGDRILEYGSWHGDWAPWNMAVVDGQVCVWDWEKFESGVPIGFDALHFTVHGPVVAGTRSAVAAFEHASGEAPQLLRTHGVDAPGAATTLWLYAVDLAARYLDEGELTAGRTRMSRLDTWLRPTLAVLGTRAATDTR
jgi:hypothetical protein